MPSNESSKILKDVVPEIKDSDQLSDFQTSVENFDSPKHQMKDNRNTKEHIYRYSMKI